MAPPASVLWLDIHETASNDCFVEASARLLAAAISGLVLGASALTHGQVAAGGVQQATAPDGGKQAACKGQNACKGQGACKTDRHGCKGQNDCKGQGGCRSMKP
jgi:hypothetical protein